MPRRKEPHPIAAKLGERIRALRQERGLTLGRLAVTSGVSKGNLSSIERGLVLVTIATLVRIARGLGLAPAHLITFPEDSPLDAPLEASPPPARR
ncbi:helix-turn-helix domain-containing protein [Polyangium aurulentum]|uniref:helix-turn-helix domain-containing protein n=1 Tax=Polyangium aurulentum TaxID=2567896 RepID=UPI0010ADF37E|nr:helix-turn-helix transcriptional regulator [Polyangium aurulentum]UQA62800.1 helix-turn-helix domain-containing protein [Polyangium aurulentum]